MPLDPADGHHFFARLLLRAAPGRVIPGLTEHSVHGCAESRRVKLPASCNAVAAATYSP